MSRAIVSGKHLWARQDLQARRLGFRMELATPPGQAICRLTPMTLRALTAFRKAAAEAGNPGMDTLEMRQVVNSPDDVADALHMAILAALDTAKAIVG